jgi:cell division protein FtsB
MKARHVFRTIGYLCLVALFAAFLVQFLAGDLGVFEANKKQRTIAELKTDIFALKNRSSERQDEIERLENDRDIIRSYALLYGMTGGKRHARGHGEVLNPRSHRAGDEVYEGNGREAQKNPQDAAAATESLQAQAGIPEETRLAKDFFLLRHPVLLVLLIAITLAGGTLYIRELKTGMFLLAMRSSSSAGKAKSSEGNAHREARTAKR